MRIPKVKSETVAIGTVQPIHREMLVRAVGNVLSSRIAKQTYAQIVDGLPISDVAKDVYGERLHNHPIFDQHRDLCPGVADETEKLCSQLDIHDLLMPLSLVRNFEVAVPGTASFSCKFIELVARAVHHIGVWLYRQDTSRHKDDALGEWRPSKEDESSYPATFPETVFCHPWYRDFDLYPEGVADCVGYWAEARILGGVILFDRRNPEVVKEASPNAVYVHADRRGVVYRICRLGDDQRDKLARFLLFETTPPLPAPLPVVPNLTNHVRVDPESAIEATGIYRDPWERRLRPLSETDLRLGYDRDELNYRSEQTRGEAKNRGIDERREREILALAVALRKKGQKVDEPSVSGLK